MILKKKKKKSKRFYLKNKHTLYEHILSGFYVKNHWKKAIYLFYVKKRKDEIIFDEQPNEIKKKSWRKSCYLEN